MPADAEAGIRRLPAREEDCDRLPPVLRMRALANDGIRALRLHSSVITSVSQAMLTRRFSRTGVADLFWLLPGAPLRVFLFAAGAARLVVVHADLGAEPPDPHGATRCAGRGDLFEGPSPQNPTVRSVVLMGQKLAPTIPCPIGPKPGGRPGSPPRRGHSVSSPPDEVALRTRLSGSWQTFVWLGDHDRVCGSERPYRF